MGAWGGGLARQVVGFFIADHRRVGHLQATSLCVKCLILAAAGHANSLTSNEELLRPVVRLLQEKEYRQRLIAAGQRLTCHCQ